MGQLDSPLTVRGLLQANALATRFSAIPFSAIYSSDLPRAAKTAEIISNINGAPIHLDPRLRERNMGIFQGLTVTEMREKYPLERFEFEKRNSDYVVPNGESANQRTERIVRCLTEIGIKHSGEKVLCVTHGGILMGFFQYVLGLSPLSMGHFKRHNAAVNAFEFNGGKWILETWGDISHLESLGTLDDPQVQD